MTTNDPGDEGFSTGNPAGFAAYHLSIGSSAREALAAYRAEGGTTGDAAWYRLYGQVADTLNRTADQAALDPRALPGPSDYSTWAAGSGGKYATQVKVLTIDQETGLASTVEFTHITSDPHTPEEAQQAAIDMYSSGDNAAKYGQVIQGAFFIHVWRTEPFGGG